jgi:hypothetical protein
MQFGNWELRFLWVVETTWRICMKARSREFSCILCLLLAASLRSAFSVQVIKVVAWHLVTGMPCDLLGGHCQNELSQTVTPFGSSSHRSFPSFLLSSFFSFLRVLVSCSFFALCPFVFLCFIFTYVQAQCPKIWRTVSYWCVRFLFFAYLMTLYRLHVLYHVDLQSDYKFLKKRSWQSL